MQLLNLMDYERAAAERLPREVLDYYSSGANDEWTLRENHAAFERLRIFYRVLVDVSQRKLGVSILGHELSMPILVAPTAFHRLAHADGELGTARAAGASGTLMILSTLSNTRVEEVVAVATGPVWFQLYVYRDRAATQALVQRVEAAGVKALVLTVDAPLLGRRERDVRNRFALPPGLCIENMLPEGLHELPSPKIDSGLAAYFANMLEPALTWKDLEWLATITKLPILVKGVVRADDSIRAVEHGAAGVVVSNHGGRQLDGSPATIDALPRIASAIGDRSLVLMDGGVRRGTDVLKALARGAKAVLLGRPVLWGLAVDGEKGVKHVLELIRDELDLALALAGVPSVAELGPELLSP